jgi:hypothetical protein
MAESADIQDILKKVEYINNNLISTKKISDISKGSDNEKSKHQHLFLKFPKIKPKNHLN